MASATQRFLSFELGRKDYERLKKTFSISVTLHVLIAVFIIVLAETIGLWFLNVKMNIPLDRMEAANWVYQFSIFTFAITVIQVPYNAAIISNERMNVYAYVSIAEVSLKLLIVFMLVWLGFDKLKLYAILIFVVALIVASIYRVYCTRKFEECHYNYCWDKSLFKSLLSFSGWSLWGNIAWVAMGQGLNIVLNIFFGPTVNASRGIAFQVNAAVSTFVNNFRTAINPQIVKSYAAGDTKYMNQLVFNSTKYSFYLLLLLITPILLETKIVLQVWLKIVPDYAVLFCQLVLINTLIQCFDSSFTIVFQATGRIKENYLLSGSLYLLVLPISYILLKLDYPPQSVFWVQIVMTTIVAFGVKFYLMKKLVGMITSNYFNQLILPVLKVGLLSIVLPILIRTNMPEGYMRFFVVSIVSIFSTSCTVYYIGLDKKVRVKIRTVIKLQILKYTHK
jgi:O-antigen/teichoic acid export membrane protein